MTSGSVRTGRRTLLAITEATPDGPWPMRVVRSDTHGRWRSATGTPLNQTPGSSAQGDLSLAGGHTWASWQENRQVAGDAFDMAVFVQRLPSRGTRVPPAQRLWSGLTPGPGRTAVVAAVGHTWALYFATRPDHADRLSRRVEAID